MGSQVSWKSQGSSTSRNLGSPTSRQSYPAESQAPNYASLPGSPSARRAPVSLSAPSPCPCFAFPVCVHMALWVALNYMYCGLA
jgi:hypothetical protein